MNKVKVSEIFRSFQGEGKYTGYPAIFVRFFGCNLRCNFGGTTEPQKIDQLKDFQVPERGCDSGYAWQSEYEHLTLKLSISEIVSEIIKLIPVGVTPHNMVLVFTGGEPMLQQTAIDDICSELVDRNVKFFTNIIETNGTVPLTTSFSMMVDEQPFHFSISPKLRSITNEPKGINIQVIESIVNDSRHDYILKFVLDNSEESWKELQNVLELLRYSTLVGRVWIMPMGGTAEQQSDIESVVLKAIQKGYKVSLRTHCYVFKNKIGS